MHVTDVELARFVSGAEDAPGLEAHVLGCAACSARLQAEAEADTLLYLAATTARPRRRWVPLAIAAAVPLAFVWLQHEPPTPVFQQAQVEVVDGPPATLLPLDVDGDPLP